MFGNTELRWVTKHGEDEKCLQYGVNNGWGTVWNDIKHHIETKAELDTREAYAKHVQQLQDKKKGG